MEYGFGNVDFRDLQYSCSIYIGGRSSGADSGLSASDEIAQSDVWFYGIGVKQVGYFIDALGEHVVIIVNTACKLDTFLRDLDPPVIVGKEIVVAFTTDLHCFKQHSFNIGGKTEGRGIYHK